MVSQYVQVQDHNIETGCIIKSKSVQRNCNILFEHHEIVDLQTPL